MLTLILRERKTARERCLWRNEAFFCSLEALRCDQVSECGRGVLVNQVLFWGLFLHLVSWIAVDRNIISLWQRELM